MMANSSHVDPVFNTNVECQSNSTSDNMSDNMFEQMDETDQSQDRTDQSQDRTRCAI